MQIAFKDISEQELMTYWLMFTMEAMPPPLQSPVRVIITNALTTATIIAANGKGNCDDQNQFCAPHKIDTNA